MAQSHDAIGGATLRWFRESATQGILTTDDSLRVASWNRWLVAATGIREVDAVGRSLLDVLPSFAQRGFDQYYNDALAGVVTVLSYSLHRFILPLRADDPREQQIGRAHV